MKPALKKIEYAHLHESFSNVQYTAIYFLVCKLEVWVFDAELII